MENKSIKFYPCVSNKDANFKCFMLADLCGANVETSTIPKNIDNQVSSYPALSDDGTVIFGANAVCRYLANKGLLTYNPSSETTNTFLDLEEFKLPSIFSALTANNHDQSSEAYKELETILSSIENSQTLADDSFASFVLYHSLLKALSITTNAKFPKVQSIVNNVATSKHFAAALEKVNAKPAVAPSAKGVASAAPAPGGKKDKKKVAVIAGPVYVPNFDDVVIPVLPETDWASTGLMSSLKIIFGAAIQAAFPQHASLTTDGAVITRCSNPTFGDFQCNNAMSLSKGLKAAAAGAEGYTGPVTPKDVADRICFALPRNQPIVASTSTAPNGFINIKVSTPTITGNLALLTQIGAQPPALAPRKVLVDFSSPNIAKEMHVGHLRSTIIGDSVCRILEFCRFDVMRVNHVGDWGTQFGMLITYLQEAFPDILTNPPNISDLTAIYKQSKARFDADELFKETSRLNVVKLQSGDEACRAIWTLLCNISRREFQVVYDALGVRLDEVGESFYNPLIPETIADLEDKGLVQNEEGMLIVRLPHFTIPLMVRKSDGGYGYDSTDMAALRYRIQELKRDWIVVITDAGQAPHFHMCFDAGRAAGWVGDVRLDHIGFGVVCGDDGKRFKTRSSETVRLIDLLNASKDRMKESLQARAEEGKSPLSGAELEEAASIIGYGAVKYFDLKQHPGTNYIFSYDRMLDTRGDTAVYLLFAYARLASILRKAREEKKIELEPLFARAQGLIVVDHPAERALAFELLQLGDVVRSVVEDLLPNRLCDYLKEVCVKFTDFVTKCHVLGADSEELTFSRLLLCEATRQVMSKCFQLLGIDTLERI